VLKIVATDNGGYELVLDNTKSGQGQQVLEEFDADDFSSEDTAVKTIKAEAQSFCDAEAS
jgi:hypothetical protein